MDTLNIIISEDTVRQIGWTLLHFLWQGTVIMALTWCVLKILSKASSNTRYTAACVALALMVLAPIITFAVQNRDSTPPPVSETATVRQEMSAPQPPVQTQTVVIAYEKPAPPQRSPFEILTARLEAALPWCVMSWIVGVAALSLWYLGGWCQLQRLRRIGTRTVPAALTETTAQLARCLGIQRAVRIVESALVQVPTVIGHLKPIILLPATALTGLDELQLKAMIAHELAHIRRCDYAVNIAQTVVEILGFYHPAVWWTSRRIRIERENACDDAAIELLQSRKQYANALFSMEAIRAKQHTLALAANGAPLTHRIRRITEKDTHTPNSGWIPSVVTILIIVSLLGGICALNVASAEDELIKQPTKQEITALFEEVDRALSSKDPNAIDRCLYFENESIRQQALEMIEQEDVLSSRILESSHILDIQRQPDGNVEVFLLMPVGNTFFTPHSMAMVPEKARYKLWMFNQDIVSSYHMTKTKTAQEIRHITAEKRLAEWKNTSGEDLEKLVQSLIHKEENNLAAWKYAQTHNLELPPHLMKEEIQKRLNKYKDTPPEQLQQELLAEWSAQAEKRNQTTSSDASTSKLAQSRLKILNTELDPVAQGKNVLYATVKNTTNTEQLFAIHIYTRSVDYGPEGIGWGTPFFEMLKPGETKRLRFVYKIQGPVTDNTYIRVKYFNPASEADYEYEKPFAQHLYQGADLPKPQATKTLKPASAEQLAEISNALKIIQNHIRNKEYENAWGLFTEDYQKAEYQIRGFEAFQKQMEPTHPTYSAFLWEKEDFLKLKPLKAFTDNGTLKLQAACDDAQWTIDFIKEDNRWKINWIAGYTPAMVTPPTRQEIAELLVGAWHALESGNAAKIDDYFYFENDSLRQRALPYLKSELGDFSDDDDVHILDMTALSDGSYKIYTLNPMSPGQACLIYPRPVVFTDGRYKLKLCTQEYFDKKVQIRKPPNEMAQELARMQIEDDLNQWKNASGQTLDELIQSKIGAWERALAAIQYAKLHNLNLVPLNAEDINQKLEEFRTTPPELLQQKVIERFSTSLENLKTPEAVRTESMNHLRQLGLAYVMFMDAHDNTPPADLQELKSYLDQKTYIELLENVLLFRLEDRINITDPATKPIAYDTTLLKEQKGTAFLFADGHVEFIQKEDLGKFLTAETIPYPTNTAFFEKRRVEIEQLKRDQITFPKNWDKISEKHGGPTEAQIRRETEAQNQLLETNVDFSALTKDTPLEQAIDSLKHQTDPPLRIIVLWADLKENAGIDKTTPIGIEGLGTMTLNDGLKSILAKLSEGLTPIDFVVDEGILTIAAKSSLPTPYRTEIYDVSHLIPPSKTPEKAAEKIEALRQTIIQSIIPKSWQENGGEGRIDPFANSKLIIWQTPEIHEKISSFLHILEETKFKYQIAIETRVMTVSNIFLEDIGLDTSVNADDAAANGVGSIVTGPANSDPIRAALQPQPLPEKELPTQKPQTLDDLQAKFVIRAAQAYRNAKTLTAPKVVVLNGEAADLRIQTPVRYMDIDDNEKDINKGVSLNLLPIIQPNADTVLLKGHIQMTDVLDTQPLEHNGKTYEIPNLQVTNIPIYTLIESEGTVLIEGPQLRVSDENRVGNPDIPIIGYGKFTTERTETGKRRLLILIKPTIIEQEEAPAQPAPGSFGGGMGGGMTYDQLPTIPKEK
jgi:prepilin-type processing-associated H-X9-DG protein